MSARPVAVSGATTDTWMAALRGGGVPAVAAGVVVVVLSGVLEGGAGAGSAAVGSALAVLALAVGPVLARLSRNLTPPGVMAVAMAGYGVVVGLLGVAFAVLGTVDWLRGGAVGVALLTCAIAWMVGHLRATGRMRVLAFGDLKDPGGSADQVSEGGAPGRSGGG